MPSLTTFADSQTVRPVGLLLPGPLASLRDDVHCARQTVHPELAEWLQSAAQFGLSAGHEFHGCVAHHLLQHERTLLHWVLLCPPLGALLAGWWHHKGTIHGRVCPEWSATVAHASHRGQAILSAGQ